MSFENRYAFFQGEIVPIEQAKVSIMTAAFNYGTGIFEGIRAYWNDEHEQLYLFRLQEHLERFFRNCRILLLDVPYTEQQLGDVAVELLRKEAFKTDVYVRPLAYKATCAVGVRLHDLETEVSMFSVPFGKYIDKPGGISVMVSSWRRLEDNTIPARGKITGAYVNAALAKTEAHLNGLDDALLLCQDGRVSEGSAANLFIVRHGNLITPPVTDDILEGITRATLMGLAVEMGVPVEERPIDRTELYVADEAFLCGTAMEVTPIVSVEHRTISDGKPGPITSRLATRYEALARGREGVRPEWHTPVYEG